MSKSTPSDTVSQTRGTSRGQSTEPKGPLNNPWSFCARLCRHHRTRLHQKRLGLFFRVHRLNCKSKDSLLWFEPYRLVGETEKRAVSPACRDFQYGCVGGISKHSFIQINPWTSSHHYECPLLTGRLAVTGEKQWLRRSP